LETTVIVFPCTAISLRARNLPSRLRVSKIVLSLIFFSETVPPASLLTGYSLPSNLAS
jgi:hypothetical protein